MYLLPLESFRLCAFLHDSTPSVKGIGVTQSYDKRSSSGEAMHGFEHTQARAGPLLLRKVFGSPGERGRRLV